MVGEDREENGDGGGFPVGRRREVEGEGRPGEGGGEEEEMEDCVSEEGEKRGRGLGGWRGEL